MKLHISASIAALLFAGAASAAPADFANLTVDAAHPIGTLKALRGVGGAPDMSYVDVSHMPGSPRPQDISAGYREARVNLVRTHDSLGAGDIDPSAGPLPRIGAPPGSESIDALVIVPNPAADPEDPQS